MLPKLLGIGAQKAGTSWLHKNLGENPRVWVPPFKEVHFFDHKFVHANRRWTSWHIRKNVRQVRQRWEQNGMMNMQRSTYLNRVVEKPMFNGNWYKKVFDPCPENCVGLDVTPEYSSVPEIGIEFIKRFLGNDVKAIYIIRDPIERAASQLKMNMHRHKQTPQTTEEWLSLANDPAINDRGNYAEHIPRWERCLNERNMHFIPFGMIRLQPDKVLRDVEKFAELPRANYKSSKDKVFRGSDVEIPESVYAYLQEAHDIHVKFLISHFGKEFWKAAIDGGVM